MRIGRNNVQLSKSEQLGNPKKQYLGIIHCFVAALISPILNNYHRSNLKNIWTYFIRRNEYLKIETFEVFLNVLRENNISEPFPVQSVPKTQFRGNLSSLYREKWEILEKTLKENNLELSDVDMILNGRSAKSIIEKRKNESPNLIDTIQEEICDMKFKLNGIDEMLNSDNIPVRNNLKLIVDNTK